MCGGGGALSWVGAGQGWPFSRRGRAGFEQVRGGQGGGGLSLFRRAGRALRVSGTSCSHLAAPSLPQSTSSTKSSRVPSHLLTPRSPSPSPPLPSPPPQVRAVHLTADMFSVDNGLLTPTFKLKRPQARAAFKAAIEAMYARLGAAGASAQ